MNTSPLLSARLARLGKTLMNGDLDSSACLLEDVTAIRTACRLDHYRNEHIAVFAAAWATVYDVEFSADTISIRILLLKTFGTEHSGNRIPLIEDLMEQGILVCTDAEGGWLANKHVVLSDDVQEAVEEADKTGSMPPLAMFPSHEEHVRAFLALGEQFRVDENLECDFAAQQQKMRQFVAKEDRSTCELPLAKRFRDVNATVIERVAMVHVAYAEQHHEIVSANHLRDLMGTRFMYRNNAKNALDNGLISKGLLQRLEDQGLRLKEVLLIMTTEMRELLGFDELNEDSALESMLRETPQFVVMEPEEDLDSVIADVAIKEQLRLMVERISTDMHERLMAWGVKIPGYHGGGAGRLVAMLYGPPGTGKSMSAYAIAKELGRKVITTDVSRLKGSFVGESEKHVRGLFDRYRLMHQRLSVPPVLVINEADSILNTRITARHSVDQMANNLVAILLEEIERFPGILILTTNYADRMDEAFDRRIDVKVEISPPDASTRERLWLHYLPPILPQEAAMHLAAEMAPHALTGSQIRTAVAESVTRYVSRTRGNTDLDLARYESILLDIVLTLAPTRQAVGFV